MHTCEQTPVPRQESKRQTNAPWCQRHQPSAWWWLYREVHSTGWWLHSEQSQSMRVCSGSCSQWWWTRCHWSVGGIRCQKPVHVPVKCALCMCIIYVCVKIVSWQLDFNILPTAEGHPRMIKLCHKQILISKLHHKRIFISKKLHHKWILISKLRHKRILISKLRHKRILISKLHHKQILISKLVSFIVKPFSSQTHKISLYTNIKQGIHTKIKHFFKFKNSIFQYCFC